MDLNWDNLEIFDDFEKILCFWLDCGVDGFCIDVVYGMVKFLGLLDLLDLGIEVLYYCDDDLCFNDLNVYVIYCDICMVIDEYFGVVIVGEVWVYDNVCWVEYLWFDELYFGFNFWLV